MKKYIVLLLMLSVTFFSCKDESFFLLDFDSLGKGAYPRLLEGGNSTFDINNPSAGQIGWTVEFVDLERGKLVKEYKVYVSLVDKSSGNGNTGKAEKLWVTKTQSEFTDSKDGYRSTTLSTTYAELNSFLGTNPGEHYAGDLFQFRSELVMEDGRVFASSNSSTVVNDPGAFFSLFNPTATLVCLYDESKFLGNYQVSYLDEVSGAFGKTFGDTPPVVELKKVSGSTTKRQFDITYIPDNPNVKSKFAFVFDLVCDKVVIASVDTKYGCATGATVTLGPSDQATFDRNNDQEVILYYEEFAKNGGCPGTQKIKLGVKLTKL